MEEERKTNSLGTSSTKALIDASLKYQKGLAEIPELKSVSMPRKLVVFMFMYLISQGASVESSVSLLASDNPGGPREVLSFSFPGLVTQEDAGWEERQLENPP